ncbi:MAG: hypothetical protein WKG01_40610 [Kofleriaceae bacterium]
MQLLYTCPERFTGYEARLTELAGSHELVKLSAGDARPRASVVSETVPTLIVVHDGEVCGEAIGDLSLHELRTVIQRALAAI